MYVPFWKEHLLILSSDFVRECFTVQSLMNAFMVQTSYMFESGVDYGQIAMQTTAQCVCDFTETINTHLYNFRAVLLSFVY